MLGVEAIPAILYFVALFEVPESPRWLIMNDRDDEALAIMERVSDAEQARAGLKAVRDALDAEAGAEKAAFRELFHPAMRLVLTIGLAVAILQQITGINSVFFYAPMIFEQSGIGTDAAFLQAVLVGLVNLVFTVLAILTIDRLGRRPLLAFGLAGIAACMLVLSYGFGSATYTLDDEAVASLPETLERGLAISFVGFVNSGVSFGLQLVFPWELESLGNSLTFLIHGAFAFIGLAVVIWLVPETKGRSLEELQAELVRV